MINRRILGSGYALPKHCVSNSQLESIVDTSDEWIIQRTGISSRYISSDENTSDLGCRAALQAIENAHINKEEIDLIVVATMTPDDITPSTACLIQEKLGLNDQHVMAFDINAACSGFVYGLQTVNCLLEEYHCALLIGSETCSKIIDWTDRNTCVLFGDGAGALIVRKENNHKRVEHFAQSIGDDTTLVAKGRALSAIPLQNVETPANYLYMNGSEVFRFAVKAFEDSIMQVLEKANKTLENIDLIIPHQANIRIIRHVAKRLKLNEDKFFINVEKFGNTSAASVAIAYAQAEEAGLLKEGMNIILVGFGAGLTYAASCIEL